MNSNKRCYSICTKKKWIDGLKVEPFDQQEENNEKLMKGMLALSVNYNKAVQEEGKLTPEKLAVANVGKLDAKKHLQADVEQLMSVNIAQSLGTMLDTVIF